MRHPHGLRAAAEKEGKGQIQFTSRQLSVTEGATSNFATAPNTGETWVYNGNNTDAIVITTSGATAQLVGFSINNREESGTNHAGILYVINGTTTGGSVVASQSFSVAVPLSSNGQTIIEFNSPVTLSPGTYVCAMAWPALITGRTWRLFEPTRSSSTVTGANGTLTVSYSSVTSFNGAGPLGSDNGTSHGSDGLGQIVTFKWLL